MQEALWRAGKNDPHTPLTNLVLDPLLIFVCHFGMAVVGLIALLVVELLPDQVMLLFGAQNVSNTAINEQIRKNAQKTRFRCSLWVIKNAINCDS